MDSRPLSAIEKVLYNATRIEAFRDDKHIASGTGFYWRVNADGFEVEYMITNKHVVAGADMVKIAFNIANTQNSGPSGTYMTATIPLHGEGLFPHPQDDVDLYAFSLVGLEMFWQQTGRRPFYFTFSRDLVPTPHEWQTLDALQDILMVGCPNGLFDKANILPIMRRGTTASHPAFHYNGRAEFMVDMACFPGSSGSPVYSYAVDGSKVGVQGFGPHVTLKLLGVLYAGPTLDVSGNVVVSTSPKFNISTMMHLGYVIKGSRVLELDDIIVAGVIGDLKRRGLR